MTTYEIGPRKSFVPLATGEYVLTLKSWEEVIEESDSQYSKKGDKRIRWTFTVAVPNEDNTERRVMTSIPGTFSEKSIFVQIISALGVVDMEKAKADGVSINPDNFVGQQCLGTIVRRVKDGKQPNDHDAWTDSITQYAPYVTSSAEQPLIRTGGNKLLERALLLEKMAGTNAPITADMSRETLVSAMKARGAQGITAHAIKWLKDADEMYVILGGNGSLLPETFEGMNLQDALKLADMIEAETRKQELE